MKELLEKSIISAMMGVLWNHREKLNSDGRVNSDVVGWIDHTLDLIQVYYFKSEPEGDNQQEIFDSMMPLKEMFSYGFEEAFDELSTRMENSGLCPGEGLDAVSLFGKQILREQGYIINMFHKKDILSNAEDMGIEVDDDQMNDVIKVLEEADANVGISNETIITALYDLES